jgi:regulator of sigma E protease
MVVLIKILQLVLALSILVLIHEFGHFIFARLFKIRVEKFYLFFDPWFSLFKYKPKNSDTEYGIGWLPLGGYCKISGMIDESMDKDAMAKDPQPWEYRSKPAWQRVFVIFGGVFLNFILAILIYSGIMYVWGEQYIKNADVTTGIYANELAQEMGFRNGDRVISFDGVEPYKFTDLQVELLRTQAKHLTPGGFFLFEIGFDQADALRRYGEERGFSQCRVLKDYGGNDRVVHLSAPTA